MISFIDFLHYVTLHHISSHRIASHRIASLHYICLVPRRLSFDENVRAKEGGLEAPEEEAGITLHFISLEGSHALSWKRTSDMPRF